MNFLSQSRQLSKAQLKKVQKPAKRPTTPPSHNLNLLDANHSKESDESLLPPGVRMVIISDTHGKHGGEFLS